MVNSRNILVGSTLTIAFTAIFAYMKKNGLTTNDITLVDACWEANADAHFHGTLNETCTDFQKEGLNWDTQVPCYRGFKEDQYYYTPRELWGVSNLSRGTKGESTGFPTSEAEATAVEDGMYRCPLVLQDPDFDASIPQTAPAAVEEVEREEYWWSPPPPPPPPPPPTCDRGDAADIYGNYKACSNSLAFDDTDEAECSGRHDDDVGGWGHGIVPFCACKWWARETTGSHWLNRGCIRHDMCLEGRGHYVDFKDNNEDGHHDGDGDFYCCDGMLNRAAGYCAAFWNSCSDSKWQAGKVFASMWFGGHDDSDCNNHSSSSRWACLGSECGAGGP